MISKQDKIPVRTATQLEQKYKFDDISKNRNDSSKQNLLIQQINQDLANFKAQINARIEELGEDDKMWFYSGEPTLENYPAADWATDELKAKHIGDMYYDVDSGDMYLFKSMESVYAWESCFGGVDYDTAYNDGYGKGYADGQQNTPNHFEYATQLYQTYYGAQFADNYELTLVVPIANTLVGCFRDATGIKKITIKGNTANSLVDFQYAFSCQSVEIIDLTEFNAKLSRMGYCFMNAKSLKEIRGVLDLSGVTSGGEYAFSNCSALIEIRFAKETIKTSLRFNASANLSPESVQSIIDGLATVEIQQTLTLPNSIVVTDEQKTTISNKNWTLVQQ